MRFRIVFFGTPAFAVPSLEALAAVPHEIAAVVTQPDRPRGRGHRVTPEAVKVAAMARRFDVLQPERLKTAEFLGQIRALNVDLGVVAAYGKILPADLLALPRLGMINVHASLLPRWRGAAPVHRAILAGDSITGVTIMRVVPALDAGPMLDRAQVDIDPNETSVDLEARLAAVGAERLVSVLERWPVAETPQDDSHATYAHRIERSEGALDWARPAVVVHNQIRGLHPWPLSASHLHGRRVMLRRSEVADHLEITAAPGTVVGIERDAILVAAEPGVVRLLELQLEGRGPLDARAFLNGHPIVVGDRFEPAPAVS